MSYASTPACCSHGASCSVGCWDDVHVRELARRLVAACIRYLRSGGAQGVMGTQKAWDAWHGLERAAADYAVAVSDPRSERQWPNFWLGRCDVNPIEEWSGWVVNADEEDVYALVTALQGPIDVRVTRRVWPDGFERVTVAEEPTFRLPLPRTRDTTATAA